MAAKINWHRYGTKLRYCHPMYTATGACSFLWFLLEIFSQNSFVKECFQISRRKIATFKFAPLSRIQPIRLWWHDLYWRPICRPIGLYPYRVKSAHSSTLKYNSELIHSSANEYTAISIIKSFQFNDSYRFKEINLIDALRPRDAGKLLWGGLQQLTGQWRSLTTRVRRLYRVEFIYRVNGDSTECIL